MARSGYSRVRDAWQTYAASVDMWEPDSVPAMVQHTCGRETESMVAYTVCDCHPINVSDLELTTELLREDHSADHQARAARGGLAAEERSVDVRGARETVVCGSPHVR